MHLGDLHAVCATLYRPVMCLQDDLVTTEGPILDALEAAILRLSLAVAKLLRAPLLSTLDTLPLRLSTEGAEDLGVQALVLIVRLRPATKALVCKLQELQMTQRNRRLVDVLRVERCGGLTLLLLHIDTLFGKQVGSRVELIVRVVARAMLVYDQAQDVLMHAKSLLEVLLRQRARLLRRRLRHVCLSHACVQLCEQLVGLNRDGCPGAVCAAHVVCNVFGEADGLDRGTSGDREQKRVSTCLQLTGR